MELRDILARCDHTLLRVDATAAEIRALCDQGMRYGCASVCIPPCHVAGAKKYVGDRLRICTVIGFPNGYNTPAVKAFEAAEAIRNGADEVDMVIYLAMVKGGWGDDVAGGIREVREAQTPPPTHPSTPTPSPTSSRPPRRQPRRSSRKHLHSQRRLPSRKRPNSRTPLTESAGRRAFAARSAPATRRGWRAQTRTGYTAGRSVRGR